jgi:hypothetical protein
MSDSLVAVTRLLRGLPLFFSPAPRTPLRVLCIIALDTLHVIRHSRPLPRKRIRALALLLDFQAGTNAAWDRKDLCHAEHDAIRQRLENAGLRVSIDEYLDRLRDLESRRPSIGGDNRRFDEVRSYREAVVRLSLATVTAVAWSTERLDEMIRATESDSDLEALFRMAMQCQIIDDVVDYREDLSAGLPSFLTACASLPVAMKLTGIAARSYGARRKPLSSSAVFPLRMALSILTAVARLFVQGARYTTSSTSLPRPFCAEHLPRDGVGKQLVAPQRVVAAVVDVDRRRLAVEDAGRIKEVHARLESR